LLYSCAEAPVANATPNIAVITAAPRSLLFMTFPFTQSLPSNRDGLNLGKKGLRKKSAGTNVLLQRLQQLRVCVRLPVATP
jgi:hypothetical protein